MQTRSLFLCLLLCTGTQIANAQSGNAGSKPATTGHFNKQLADELDTIYHLDQDDRVKAEEVYKTHGTNSKEWRDLFVRIRYYDSVNLVRVQRILDTYGWPGSLVAGEQGNETVFLIVQHADLKTQKKYLPVLRKAVVSKKALPRWQAMMEDRIAVSEHRRQTYSSQVAGDPAGSFLSPLADPDHVDERRAKMGMGPIAEYLKQYDLNWDVEAYKKQLPELEKRQSKID